MAKIKIATTVGDAKIDADVFGAWAAHPDHSYLGYRVTFLRFGLCVPYLFETRLSARQAAKQINELRSEWGDITGAELKRQYGGEIKKICSKRPGCVSRGPTGEMVPISRAVEAL